MMTTNATQETSAVLSAPMVDSQASVFRSGYSDSHLDLRETYAYESDVLIQLKANIAQLEDLHGRLKYMMAEIGYLIKK